MKRQAEQFKRFKQLIEEINNKKLNSACQDQSESATPGKANKPIIKTDNKKGDS